MFTSSSHRRVFEYMEGFVTCAVFASLEAAGRLDELATNGLRNADLGSNPFLAAATLRYLAQRGVLQGDGDLYRLTDLGRELYDDRSYLIWLSGGYGEPMHRFGDLLTARLRFGADVDRDMHWVAVGTALAGQKELLPQARQLLDTLQFDRVADVGCGNGHLLISLCASGGTGERSGVGVDVSSAACADATREVAKAGLGDRIKIVQADAKDPSAIPELESMQLVIAFFFLHEVLEDGYDVLVDYLRRLCGRLPAGAHVLTAEIAPPQQDQATAEVFTPEYVLTQALMDQTLLDETGWSNAFGEAGFEVTRIVEADLPGTRLILARKPA